MGELQTTGQVSPNPISPLQSPPNCPVEFPKGSSPTSRGHFPLTPIVQDVCSGQDSYFRVLGSSQFSERRPPPHTGGGLSLGRLLTKTACHPLSCDTHISACEISSSEMKEPVGYDQLKCREGRGPFL